MSLEVSSKVGKESKVGYAFTSKYTLDDMMVSKINKAVLERKSICIGEMKKEKDRCNGLINVDIWLINNRLVIQILYGVGKKTMIKIKNL